MNQLPNVVPQYPDHEAATAEHLAFWQGSADGDQSLPLQLGLAYYNTMDGRTYKSVAAATANESWIDGSQWSDLADRVEGFKADLASMVTVADGALQLDDSDGLHFSLDESAINAGLLNGQTAQQIIDAARTRQRVHNVATVIDPNIDTVPESEGATWVTMTAGQGLTALTTYRKTAGGANQTTENLIPGDYVLVENGVDPDIAYIVKTDDSGVIVLSPVGEDELQPPELQLVQLLTAFGGARIELLLQELEDFGVENLRNEFQITEIADAKASAVQALLQQLIDFGPFEAVQLLTALQMFGTDNLISIDDVETYYLSRNIKINFSPVVGSSNIASPWYERPYEAPFDNMTVNAIPDGYAAGFVFKNFATLGPATVWVRV